MAERGVKERTVEAALKQRGTPISRSMLNAYKLGQSVPPMERGEILADYFGADREFVFDLIRKANAILDREIAPALRSDEIREIAETAAREAVRQALAILKLPDLSDYTEADYKADDAFLATVPGLRYDLIRGSNPSLQTVRELARAYREEEEAELGASSRSGT